MKKKLIIKFNIIIYIKRKIILFLFTREELNYLIDLTESNQEDAFRQQIRKPYHLTFHFDFNMMNNIILKLKFLFPEYTPEKNIKDKIKN